MWVFILLVGVAGVHSLDNGLALTPPMGWMSWQRFRCETNCDLYPDECISENLFKRIAHRMVMDGYKNRGYEYVIVNDCWSAMTRDKNGRLYGDPKRFPSGMKALGDYIHSLGLKFGLYGSYGTHTCGGYPGNSNHLKLDADTYAEWGVDYVKVDPCNADSNTYEKGFAEYGKYLNKTGRPMVFSCGWPAHQEIDGKHPNYEAIKKTCNQWRNYYDMRDSWEKVKEIVNWFAKEQKRIAPASGPGHWNDPDGLIIGDFGLSIEQSKAQMTIWSIMSAPLIMSNDLDTIRPEFKEILLNKLAVEINQDALGVQGLLVQDTNNIKVWMKSVLPKVGDYYSAAVGFISYRSDGTLYPGKLNLEKFELKSPTGYDVTNVFTGEKWKVDKDINVRVPPSGAVFLKLTPATEPRQCVCP